MNMMDSVSLKKISLICLALTGLVAVAESAPESKDSQKTTSGLVTKNPISSTVSKPGVTTVAPVTSNKPVSTSTSKSISQPKQGLAAPLGSQTGNRVERGAVSAGNKMQSVPQINQSKLKNADPQNRVMKIPGDTRQGAQFGAGNKSNVPEGNFNNQRAGSQGFGNGQAGGQFNNQGRTQGGFGRNNSSTGNNSYFDRSKGSLTGPDLSGSRAGSSGASGFGSTANQSTGAGSAGGSVGSVGSGLQGMSVGRNGTAAGNSASQADVPKYNSSTDTFVFGDGTSVRGTDPSGSRGTVNDKGDIVYSDGTTVVHDGTSGTTTILKPDGTSSVRYGNTPSYDSKSDTFVYPDGERVQGTDPGGNRGTVNEDGSISYSDGTQVSHDANTRTSEITHADGSIERSSSVGGPAYNSETDTFVYGNGTEVVARDPSGSIGSVNEKGDITYSDGTIVTHDSETGTTTIIRPDGTTRTHQGDTSGDSNGSGTDGGSTSGSDNSDSSGGKNSDSDGKDTSSSEDGKDTSDSSDNSGEKDTSGSDSSGSDGKDSDGKDTGGDKNSVGIAGGGGIGVKGQVQDIVDRKTGMKRDRNSQDAGCGKKGSGGTGPTSQPGKDGDCSNNPMAGRGIKSDGNSTSRPAVYIPGSTRRVVKPGSQVVDPDRFAEERGTGGRTYDPFTKDPVVNPGGN